MTGKKKKKKQLPIYKLPSELDPTITFFPR